MARWEPNAHDRLQQAALDLYGERGFEQTTVAEIAKRAGLTERTFFRYFADKPEVLFSGAEALEEGIVTRVASAPDSTAPIEAVVSALEATGDLFHEIRGFSVKRQAVIEANAELRERELIKLARLGSAIADTLRRRGVGDPAATLTAEAGIAAFKTAFRRWISEPDQQDFAALIRESMADLKAVMTGHIDHEGHGGVRKRPATRARPPRSNRQATTAGLQGASRARASQHGTAGSLRG